MNKLVLISGSSRGLGAAMAKSFSESGYEVAINYFHSEKEAKDLFIQRLASIITLVRCTIVTIALRMHSERLPLVVP